MLAVCNSSADQTNTSMMQGNGADMENIVAVDQDSVVDAVVALNPAPRETRWGSISLCVLDAVWSIAAHYDRVVDPLVRAFAEANGIERPVISVDDRLLDDPCPSSRLASLDVEALLAVTNRQRTSTTDSFTTILLPNRNTMKQAGRR